MTISTAWILKARRERRSIADVMREHGEAGSPPFDSNHPFWVGCEAADRLPTLVELHELQAASAELARSEPKIATCQDCRATYETGTKCEPCAMDAQAAPGQPIPKEMEPEDPADEVK